MLSAASLKALTSTHQKRLKSLLWLSAGSQSKICYANLRLIWYYQPMSEPKPSLKQILLNYFTARREHDAAVSAAAEKLCPAVDALEEVCGKIRHMFQVSADTHEGEGSLLVSVDFGLPDQATRPNEIFITVKHHSLHLRDSSDSDYLRQMEKFVAALERGTGVDFDYRDGAIHIAGSPEALAQSPLFAEHAKLDFSPQDPSALSVPRNQAIEDRNKQNPAVGGFNQ